MQVPFLDLKAQHAPIREEIARGLAAVIDDSAFAGGKYVAEFEADFARYCGTRFAVGVGNGTESLWLCLLALGIKPGDEVITVAATFIATAEAISHAGAVPVFVDVDDRTSLMDPALLEAAITPRTKAIIPVHLYGQVADMDPILRIARAHDIPVIEDAAQAHGATYRGRKAGSLGRAGSFSFYPGKNLGAMGEAGAITTDDADLAERLRVLRDHGQRTKYNHFEIGWNSRMDGLQAAVLRIKLRRLDEGNRRRRAHAEHYRSLLADVPGIGLAGARGDGESSQHLFVVRVRDRDRIVAEMAKRGIGCGIHYPIPVHRQPAYAGHAVARTSLPVTERWAGEVVSLPMYPELQDAQVAAAAAALKAVVVECAPVPSVAAP
jgi:dTDP-4-amino-4,6-dideoxygalactose transaminase